MSITELSRELLAETIADKWVSWDSARNDWKKDKQELRNYIFSTSTSTTTNSKLPWKNKTVTPKLTQIRDNLHANYIAALFPSENWFIWEGSNKDAATVDKRNAITNYMRTKLKSSGFELLVAQLIYDYIDYGNVFVSYDFVRDVMDNGADVIKKYIGPKAYRINPLDIVFNPTAVSFDKSPVIIRTIKGLGDLQDDINTKPGLQYNQSALDKAIAMRKNMAADPDFKKNFNISIDGFGSFDDYIASNNVELLDYYGDYYDTEANKLYKNQMISIIDRSYVIRNVPSADWTGGKPFYHCGWRLRPENLWAQGPLDQLVGLQYRIDHLENLKADVFDLIAYPVIKVMGNTVEDVKYFPGSVVYCGDEGNVEFLRPDPTALAADMQIQELMNRMEELAGAPKQAMGIRTPGEKTKYEVQTLENAAGRIFQSKVNWFERNVLEPLLNGMLGIAAKNIDTDVVIGVDPDYNTPTYMSVSKQDLASEGKLYPIGARHFAEKARFVQELTTTMQAVQTIPSMAPHISGKQAARALEDALGWKNYGIVKDNVYVEEQADTQRLINSISQDLQVENSVDATNAPNPEETQT